MKKIAIIIAASVIISSCKTVDLELTADEYLPTAGAVPEEKQIEEVAAEQEAESSDGLYILDELRTDDVGDTVIYIERERPVYRPEPKSDPNTDRPPAAGKNAAVESLKQATIKPQQYKLGTFFYQYNDNLVYEIYAQKFHLTDISLEPGEVVTSKPLFSEDETVWELTAGVSKDTETGLDIQHLFIKPAWNNQDSTLIVITDRRVYHFRCLSYADTHMAMVKFTYPGKRNQWAKKKEPESAAPESVFIKASNPEFISVDYKITYSRLRKTPEFTPRFVYDDGQTTYILVDDIVLQKKLPLLFNEKNEIMNYVVKKNLFVVPCLIDKATLRLGKEKVTIHKKMQKVAAGNPEKEKEQKPEPVSQSGGNHER